VRTCGWNRQRPEAFDLWKGSWAQREHAEPNFTVIGVAHSYGALSFGWYWSGFGGQDDYVPPPPAPTAPPAAVPAPTAVTTPETPVPGPAPAPVPTAQPTDTPAPTPAPRWQDIATEVRPWWDQLTVVGQDGSVLRSLSFLVARYLEWTSAQFVDVAGGSADQSILPEQLWPTTFS
jgi:hypothetical protein